MMDKLRACIVANFYANAGMTKLQEVISSIFQIQSAVNLFIFFPPHHNVSLYVCRAQRVTPERSTIQPSADSWSFPLVPLPLSTRVPRRLLWPSPSPNLSRSTETVLKRMLREHGERTAASMNGDRVATLERLTPVFESFLGGSIVLHQPLKP